ncbi:MAG: DUF192 domain-containing protein [Candidatus Pacebacteria bacterium]|nr:DUF192 domain-containing protein [Candidatus Paceibacterota bacterium]
MKNKKILTLFFTLLVLAGAFHVWKLSNSNRTTRNDGVQVIKEVQIKNKIIKVEVADDNKEKEKGLSGRKSLKESSGMLFMFDVSGDYIFWMKDMKIPIDIIWINEYLYIVHIEEGVIPETYPITFKSPSMSKYVLEVSTGFSSKNNFKVGDRVEFRP